MIKDITYCGDSNLNLMSHDKNFMLGIQQF